MSETKKVIKKILETKKTERPSRKEIYDAVIGEKFWGDDEDWPDPEYFPTYTRRNEPEAGDVYNISGQKFEVVNMKAFEDPIAKFRPSTVKLLVGNVNDKWLILSWTTDEGFGDFELVWFDSKKAAVDYFRDPKPDMFDQPE